MKLRLITRKNIEKAYSKEDIDEAEDLQVDKTMEDVPEEVFKIISEIVNYMEDRNRELEEDYENK